MWFARERQDIAYIMRRLYRQGLTTTSGGNVSCRAGGDCVLLTASANDKARLTAAEVGVMTLAGANLTLHIRPSIEAAMHRRIYQRNPSVRAIVHAHPVTASAFTAIDAEINTRLTAEAYAIVGVPVMAPYACMGTPELADIVAAAVGGGAFCVLMRNHGVLAVGNSLLQAFDRLEVLETAARQTLLLRGMPVQTLDDGMCRDIDCLMGR